MNIQIFGKSKCFDTKKAERFFKERKIDFQYIDILDKGLSKGEYSSVSQAVGGFDELVDKKNKNYFKIQYIGAEQREDMLLEMPNLFRTPIVRNKKRATIGYQPDVWSKWIMEDKL